MTETPQNSRRPATDAKKRANSKTFESLLMQENGENKRHFTNPTLTKSYRESLAQLVDFETNESSESSPTKSHSSNLRSEQPPPAQQPRKKLNPERASFAAMLNQQRAMAGIGTPPRLKTASQASTPDRVPESSRTQSSTPKKLSSPDMANRLNAMFQKRLSQTTGPSSPVERELPKPRTLPTESAPVRWSDSDTKEVAKRFRRMLQMGVPAGAVRNQMNAEGYQSTESAALYSAVFSNQPLDDLIGNASMGMPEEQAAEREEAATSLPQRAVPGHGSASRRTQTAHDLTPDSAPLPSNAVQAGPETALLRDKRDMPQSLKPSPQEFLTAAVLTNALYNNKQFQKQRELKNPEEYNSAPIETLSLVNNNDRSDEQMDDSIRSMGEYEDGNGSLSTLGSVEAGPKSKEWRQAQLEQAERIRQVYQGTQRTAEKIETDPSMQLPKMNYPTTQEMVATKKRQKESATILMDKMVGESELFHRQQRQILQSQSETAVDPVKSRKVSFHQDSEPKRLVDLKPVAAKGNEGVSADEEKQEIEMEYQESVSGRDANMSPVDTTIPASKLKQKISSLSVAEAGQYGTDSEPGGGTMHLSEYNRRQFIRCGLCVLLLILVPIVIGLSTVARNSNRRRQNDEALVVNTPSPSNLKTISPSSELPTVSPSAIITLATNRPTGNLDQAPSMPPVELQRDELLSILLPLTLDNGTSIETIDTPQSLAFEWLVLDVGPNDIDSTRVIQRFALATLYYATNGLSSNRASARSWLNASGWLDSAVDECFWYGSSCESGIITSLKLSRNQLIGTIPNEISMLSQMESLSLNQNALQSTIPSALGMLARLENLDLSSNSLSGTLASEMGQLISLSELLLQANRMTGAIPNDLQNLSLLETIRLDSNQIEGRVPDAVCLAFSTFRPRFYADCGGTSPDIICPAIPCCTYCCDAGACECLFAGSGFEFLC